MFFISIQRTKKNQYRRGKNLVSFAGKFVGKFSRHMLSEHTVRVSPFGFSLISLHENNSIITLRFIKGTSSLVPVFALIFDRTFQ